MQKLETDKTSDTENRNGNKQTGCFFMQPLGKEGPLKSSFFYSSHINFVMFTDKHLP